MPLDEGAALGVGQHEAGCNAGALAMDRYLAALFELLDQELALRSPERALDDAAVAAPFPDVGALRLDHVGPPAGVAVRVAHELPDLIDRRVDERLLRTGVGHQRNSSTGPW
jgi:hypothetical protein